MERLPYPILRRLFRCICNDAYYEELEGDLEESYYSNKKLLGDKRAKQLLRNDLLSMARPSVIRKFKLTLFNFSTDMIINYIKIAFRTIAKEKIFSIINITGLAVGISAYLLLMQYVNHESSYDNFHREGDTIYRIAIDQTNPTSGAIEAQNASSFYAINSTIKDEIPEVEKSTQLFSTTGVFDFDGELFREDKIYFASSSFFDVFSFPVKAGNYQELDNINTIFLSETTARKYFGQQDPIGKKISFNSGFRNPFELEVRGVFQDFPQNSHIKANALVSLISFESHVDENQLFGPQLRFDDVKWRWMQFYNYIKIDSRANAKEVAAKVQAFGEKYRKALDEQQGRLNKFILQPIRTIHLESNRSGEMDTPGSKRLNQFLFYTGLLIILIAWINYINLATAKATNRGKEVGVRKVIGANQSQLRVQFLFESFLMNFMAILLALLISYIAAPYFTSLTGKDIWSLSFSHSSIGKFLLFILSGSIIAGLYPAMVLSSYKPIAVLKGKFSKSKAGIVLRKSLVVFQFGVAVFLLSGIYAVFMQLDFMINHETGITIQDTFVIQRPPLQANASASQQKIEIFKDNLMALAEVEAVTVATYMPGPENLWKQTCFISGNSDKSVLLSRVGIDPNYLDFFGIKLEAGQDFHSQLAGISQRVIINEKLAHDFGFDASEEILGKSIELPGGQLMEIIGVVEDYYHRGVRFPVEPLMLHLDSTANGQFLAVRTKSQTIETIRNAYNASFPNTLFEYTQLDETFRGIYVEDRRFKSIISLFTVVAVAIACLGLLGLSSYMLTQRLKEISIRKILGAKVSQLINLLVAEYILLSVIGAALSIPFGYYFISNWLNSYVSRISISPIMFIAPVLIVILLILVTIGYQTLKAALVNPAECLKNE